MQDPKDNYEIEFTTDIPLCPDDIDEPATVTRMDPDAHAKATNDGNDVDSLPF